MPRIDSQTVGGQSSSNRREKRSRLIAWLCVFPSIAFVVLMVIGPWLAPFNPRRVIGRPSQPPSTTYWFGTDSTGLDVFSRVLAGARIDLAIGISVAVAATVIGIALGLTLALGESRRGAVGFASRGALRALELLHALPGIMIGLIVVAMFKASAVSIAIAITVIIAPLQARLVRTEVLRVRSEAYVEAARIAGLSGWQVMVRHILPNASWPAVHNIPFVFGIGVILTAALGFLGVGIPPPEPEWGAMLSRGASDASVGRWWSATFPGLALILAVASVSLLHSSIVRLRAL